MKYRWRFLLTAALVLGSNCNTFAEYDPSLYNITPLERSSSSSALDAITMEQPDLSGEWHYQEDLGGTQISLDKNGNGTYPWQKGHIITTSVSGVLWQGIWIQEGNDREGNFEVTLSSDGTEAEGTWWYTRIGTVHIPARQQGGNCRLERLSQQAAHQ
jgi:hypothetical protein